MNGDGSILVGSHKAVDSLLGDLSWAGHFVALIIYVRRRIPGLNEACGTQLLDSYLGWLAIADEVKWPVFKYTVSRFSVTLSVAEFAPR